MNKPKVAFICVHNCCRSQIAEALGKYYAQDVFVSYSAGTKIKAQIDPAAVRLLKQMYGIDMEKEQYPKTLAEIPPVDVVITMGCKVECPDLPGKYRQDWGLTDPSGKSDEEFVAVIRQIASKVLLLKATLKQLKL